MNFSGVARSKEAMPSGRHVRRMGIGGRAQRGGGSGATLCYVLEQITGLFYVNQEQRGSGAGEGEHFVCSAICDFVCIALVRLSRGAKCS